MLRAKEPIEKNFRISLADLILKALPVLEELRLNDPELEAAGDHQAAPTKQQSGHRDGGQSLAPSQKVLEKMSLEKEEIEEL